MSRIGLISDTHGLLRPEALDFLAGCERIVHAGDIGAPEILDALARVAPVTAVRGNNDKGEWADRLPDVADLRVGAVVIRVIHDLADLAPDPASEGVRVFVTGHSHKPRVEERGGVIYVNPGSAGPRRFTLPISVGELIVDGDRVSARTVELQVAKAR